MPQAQKILDSLKKKSHCIQQTNLNSIRFNWIGRFFFLSFYTILRIVLLWIKIAEYSEIEWKLIQLWKLKKKNWWKWNMQSCSYVSNLCTMHTESARNLTSKDCLTRFRKGNSFFFGQNEFLENWISAKKELIDTDISFAVTQVLDVTNNMVWTKDKSMLLDWFYLYITEKTTIDR